MRSYYLRRIIVLFLIGLTLILTVIYFDDSLISQGLGRRAARSAQLSNVSNRVEEDYAIHLAAVCGGFNSTRQLYTLLKSILFYRTKDLQLHLLVDNIAQKILKELFRTWPVSGLKIRYYNITEYERQVTWVTSPHYSHRYGLMKLVFPSILAQDNSIPKVIMLDTDMLVLGDINTIWTYSQNNKSSATFALVENQSDWYLGNPKLSGERHIWPALGKGYNSGLMMIDLVRLSAIGWDRKWRQVADIELTSALYTALADQDVYNTVFKLNPDLVQTLPCYFNLQLNDHTNLTKSCPHTSEFRLVHWNSPYKFSTNNPDAHCFLTWYRTFKNWSGRLVERDPCCKVEERVVASGPKSIQSPCDQLKPSPNEPLRTFLYFKEFQIKELDNDVTLVVHLSIERLPVFEQLASHWTGPISVAIYLPESETDALEDYIQSSEYLADRQDIGYHLVFRDKGLNYPINRLRNIALDQARTPNVYLSDVDFLPSHGLHEHLRRTISKLRDGQDLNPLEKRAIVIPAFENSQYRLDYPFSKMDLLTQLDLGIVTTFREQIWPKGQAPTDYRRWRFSTKLYKVLWEPDYEPFVVTSRDVLRFDESFVGFGWNKVEHTTMMAATGYEFFVDPEAFMIHKFHPASFDTMKHRESTRYKSCIKYLKKSFLLELKANHPEFFANFSGDYRHVTPKATDLHSLSKPPGQS